jgi:hypothetical protein
MSKPATEPPPLMTRAPEIRTPPKGTAHQVGPGDSWVTLAKPLHIDPWELIEFNFPGTLTVMRFDPQRATRQVNWYLEQYVGCTQSNDGGKNYAFGSGLAGRGRGDYKDGRIYLPPPRVAPPPPPPPPATHGCVAIQIPPLNLPLAVRAALALAKVELPSDARCLDDTKEIPLAKTIYGESLDYGRIYVSDGLGGDGRPVTIAIPFDSSWIVIMNIGSWAFNNPAVGAETRATLIHELAHAWQSQHHSDPAQFMINCSKSQLAAAAATVAAEANRLARKYNFGIQLPDFGPADAYSYVPGNSFGDYGGEQTAQQVEDHFSPPSLPDGRTLTAREAGLIARIPAFMKAAGKNAVVAENVRSLGSVKYAHKNFSGVIWHE